MLRLIFKVAIGCAILASGCATPFHPFDKIGSDQLTAFDSSKNVLIRYKAEDWLKGSGNKRYAKKAEKNDYFFLPVIVQNIGNDTLSIDLSKILVFNNLAPIEIVPSTKVTKKLKQNVFIYLLYGLLDFKYSSQEGIGVGNLIDNFPLFFAFGSANAYIAYRANSKI